MGDIIIEEGAIFRVGVWGRDAWGRMRHLAFVDWLGAGGEELDVS